MNQMGIILSFAGVAILLLYVWIIWTASSNGRSVLLWFILIFFITPWLVAFILAIAGESTTKKELRELKITVHPEQSDVIEIKHDKDILNRFILVMIVLVLHLICIGLLLR